MAFIRGGESATDPGGIWILNRDTADIREVYAGKERLVRIEWPEDGQLVFVTARASETEASTRSTYSISPTGKNEQLVAGEDVGLTLSEDGGAQVLYWDTDFQAEDGKPTLVLAAAGGSILQELSVDVAASPLNDLSLAPCTN